MKCAHKWVPAYHPIESTRISFSQITRHSFQEINQGRVHHVNKHGLSGNKHGFSGNPANSTWCGIPVKGPQHLEFIPIIQQILHLHARHGVLARCSFTHDGSATVLARFEVSRAGLLFEILPLKAILLIYFLSLVHFVFG